MNFKVNHPQNNRDLNQGLIHLWPKFGDPSFNGWWVIARTSTWLPHTQTDGRTHRQTDAGNDNTRRPKLASGKNLRLLVYIMPPPQLTSWVEYAKLAITSKTQINPSPPPPPPPPQFCILRNGFHKDWSKCCLIWQVLGHGQAHVGQMGKLLWQCTITSLDKSIKL